MTSRSAPKLHTFPQSEVPEYFQWQILSFFRTHWPDGFANDNLYRDWICPEEYHLTAIIVAQEKLLISYAGVVWKILEHQGQPYKMYGLSGVFTFPSFRKCGYGSQAVKAAATYIQEADADIVLFTSMHQGFYEKFGFQAMPTTRLLVGDPSAPSIYNEITYMRFLSPKGLQAQASFEKTAIYFGTEVW